MYILYQLKFAKKSVSGLCHTDLSNCCYRGRKRKKDVKTISDIINSTRPLDDHDDDMLSEIESLLSGDIDMELSSCDRSNAVRKNSSAACPPCGEKKLQEQRRSALLQACFKETP
jgi:hypothetical protein